MSMRTNNEKELLTRADIRPDLAVLLTGLRWSKEHQTYWCWPGTGLAWPWITEAYAYEHIGRLYLDLQKVLQVVSGR